MKENIHPIDQIFQQAEERFREMPPDSLWNRLSDELDAQDAAANRHAPKTWPRLALAATLLLASLLLADTPIRFFGSGPAITTTTTANTITPAPVIQPRTSSTQPDASLARIAPALPLAIRLAVPPPAVDLPAPKMPRLAAIQDTSQPVQLMGRFNDPVAKRRRAFSLTPFLSYDWAGYRLDRESAAIGGAGATSPQELGERETMEASYSAGLLVGWQGKGNWGLKSGLIYSHISIAIAPQEIFASKDAYGKTGYRFNTSTGYAFLQPSFGPSPAPGDSLHATEAQHNIQVLSLPFQISRRFGKKKWSLVPAAGIAANIITRASVKTELAENTRMESVTFSRLEGIRKIYASAVADLTLQYAVNEKVSLSLIPSLRYALQPSTKNNIVKTYPYSGGIGAGLTYKF